MSTKMKYFVFIFIFTFASLMMIRIGRAEHPFAMYGEPRSIPPDWQARIKQGNMLYTPTEPTDEELMASVGNGYVATTVGSDTQFIGGVYNGPAISANSPSHRARIPGTLSISITNSVATGSALDLQYGVYYRRSSIQPPNNGLMGHIHASSNPIAFCEQRWYAHREMQNLMVHEIEVYAQDQRDLNAEIPLQLTVNSGSASQDINFKKVTEGSDFVMYSGSIYQTEEKYSDKVQVAYVTTKVPPTVNVTLASNSSTLYFITAFRTSLDSDNPEQDAMTTYKAAVQSQQGLLTSHINEWIKLWYARIEVSGNLPLAQAINSSLYYLLSSVRDDWPYSLSPGGLASNGYNGHVFWDAETWMYPTLLLTNPAIAQSMLEYRFNRRLGAMDKAKSYHSGYNGTMYPWESAFTGEEVCPTSAPTGLWEQHITGDIGFALKQYWYLTNDYQWLKNFGFPMIYDIAEFWGSRVRREPTASGYQYVIDGVIPPDEYAPKVNNSVYTNVVAKYSLEFAKEAGSIVGISTPSYWDDIAANMKIPFDPQTQIHPEYDGYAGQTIKQADVVLLGFPLMYPMDMQVRKNDLVYYSQRTDPNGPAMTWSMYCTAWIELGDMDTAAEIFSKSYANIQSPFNVWTETPTGGTVNFITGAGGFLQGIWGGYTGLRIHQNALMFKPTLPNNVTSIAYKGLYYLGNRFGLSYDQSSVTFELQETSKDAFALYLTQNNQTLPLVGTVKLSLGEISLHPKQGISSFNVKS